MTIEDVLNDIDRRLNRDSRMVIWSPYYCASQWDVHIDLEWDVDGDQQRLNIRRKANTLLEAATAAHKELLRITDALPEAGAPLLTDGRTIDHD